MFKMAAFLRFEIKLEVDVKFCHCFKFSQLESSRKRYNKTSNEKLILLFSIENSYGVFLGFEVWHQFTRGSSLVLRA